MWNILTIKTLLNAGWKFPRTYLRFANKKDRYQITKSVKTTFPLKSKQKLKIPTAKTWLLLHSNGITL